MLILFKSCLLALNTFKKKRILSLDEVKRILIETCRRTPEYNETVKEIVYLGIKIIHLAIKLNNDNLKEILTMNGVEIIQNIFQLILRNGFNTSELAPQSFYRSFAIEEEEKRDPNELMK